MNHYRCFISINKDHKAERRPVGTAVGRFCVKRSQILGPVGTDGRTISPTDIGFGDSILVGFNFGFWVSSTDDQRRSGDYFESKLISCIINCLYKLVSLF